ncbi:MAG TPA: cation diffusion facilitator family transporter, partial [Bacillota bacterium]|nr:cation diffusion facilitator family transporter [Bacillota bacterium]
YISAIFSRKEQDKEHPYGHEKYDSIISMFLGIAIIITAFEVGKNAVYKLYDFFVNGIGIDTPKWYALGAAALTILIKEFLFRKTKHDAKKAKSGALMAQAWDHRSDTIASFGAVIGITGAMLGAGYLDPIASILIAFFIFRVGFKIVVAGIGQVVDKSADSDVEKAIKDLVKNHTEIKSLDLIKTRMFGMKIYVDLEIGLDYSLTLEKAHEIAEMLHDEIEEAFPEVLHCMIHVNPFYPKK